MLLDVIQEYTDSHVPDPFPGFSVACFKVGNGTGDEAKFRQHYNTGSIKLVSCAGLVAAGDVVAAVEADAMSQTNIATEQTQSLWSTAIIYSQHTYVC